MLLFLVTQWELPPEFLPPPVPGNFGALGAPPPFAPAPPGAPATTVKRLPEKAELEERSDHQPAKRRGRPYGEWSTVAEIEKDDDELEDQGGDIEGTKEEETTEEVHFEEKRISEGLTAETDLKGPGDFKGFAFKKRTGKGRPQVRQRTSDF